MKSKPGSSFGYLIAIAILIAATLLVLARSGQGRIPYRHYLPSVSAGASLQAAPTPVPFRLVEAWLIGSQGDRQTVYRPGEPVYLYIKFVSPADADGLETWIVSGPAGRVMESETPATFSAGEWTAYNEYAIPEIAESGVYTFTIRAEYPGTLAQELGVRFEVVR